MNTSTNLLSFPTPKTSLNLPWNEHDTKIQEARNNYNAAREIYITGKTKKARREAAEDMEFWGNKLAFLGAVR